MDVIAGISDVLSWCMNLFNYRLTMGHISFTLLEVFGVVVAIYCVGNIIGTGIDAEH